MDYFKIHTEKLDLTKIEIKQKDSKKITTNHNLVIASVQRDYSLYNYPNDYFIDLAQPYRNVEKMELIAVMLPKTEYNVNTNNNVIKIKIGSANYQYLRLTPGQYTIGSNIHGESYKTNGLKPVSGLIGELNSKLNTIGNFNVILCTRPPPEGTGNNASLLNRISIINTDNTSFTIDFTFTNSAYQLLGYQKDILQSNNTTAIYGYSDGTCTPDALSGGTINTLSDTNITSIHDYNLADDINYIIMELTVGKVQMPRNESIDKNINNTFCVVLYDANDPDTIENTNITKIGTNDVQVLNSRKPGRLKALKGTDFDKKILTFDPPQIIENLGLKFYKYNNEPYDFHNREHLLLFDITTVDFDTRYKY